MRKGSIKSTRINSEMQKELSKIIQFELKDPGIYPLTSVVSCEVTMDLKYCKAYISVLSNEEDKAETLKALKKATPFIRRQLAGSLNLRNTPEIKFIIDNSLEYGMRMDALLESIKTENSDGEDGQDEIN